MNVFMPTRGNGSFKIIYKIIKTLSRLFFILFAIHVLIYFTVEWRTKLNTSGVSNPNKGLEKHVSIRSVDAAIQGEELPNIPKIPVAFKHRQPLSQSRRPLANASYELKHNKMPLVIYNRVPKCGSTTIVWLIKALGSRLGFKTISHNWPHVQQILTEDEQKNLVENVTTAANGAASIFIRHLHFVDFEKFSSSVKPIYINVIRNPIERFISHYYYMRFGFGNGNSKAWMKNMSNATRFEKLEECVAKSAEKCVQRESSTTLAFFCGQGPKCRTRSPWALQKAKENVVKYYTVVGIVEDFPNTLRLLEYTLPRYFRRGSEIYKRAKGIINKSKTSKKVSPRLETKLKLEEALRYEMDFYQFVKKRFYDQLNDLNLKRNLF
ncbi:uronyl 2-sulfotransferase-like [Styela clava]